MTRAADPALVEIRARLEEAADTLRRLPYPREYAALKGGQSTMPEYVRNAVEAYGYNDAEPPKIRPSAEAIDRMDEALGWLRWLPEQDARLVWMRAMRIGWKRISAEFHIDRTTAWRYYTAAIMVIAARLEAERRAAA